MSGDRVPLAAQRRNPEAVDNVVRVQYEIDRETNRQVQLVGGVDVCARVIEFPPELMADDLYVHGARWGRRLGLEDDRQRQEQDVAHYKHSAA